MVKNELLKALARCRVILESDAEKVFQLKPEEIEELILQKIIVRKETNDKKKVLLLTEKGEHFFKQENPEFGEIYRGFILEHDLTLMDFYLRRTKEERDSWSTKDDMIKAFQLRGTLDGAFINQKGCLEGVEVLKNTAKYSSVEKAEEFIKEVGIQEMNYLIYS